MKLSRFVGPALAGLAALAVVVATAISPAISADLPRTVASPGTLYELGSFSRRGVTIQDGGTLEIRADGCWVTNMTIFNSNPDDRVVSVSFRWFTSGGRTIVDLPVVISETIAGGGTLEVAANGCSNAVARNYGTIAATSVTRYMTVR